MVRGHRGPGQDSEPHSCFSREARPVVGTGSIVETACRGRKYFRQLRCGPSLVRSGLDLVGSYEAGEARGDQEATPLSLGPALKHRHANPDHHILQELEIVFGRLSV